MAKNTTKAADPQAATANDEGSREDASLEEGNAVESSILGLDALEVDLEASILPRDVTTAGLILHSTFAESISKQIAARGAIRTAYYCVFGHSLPEAVAVAWSEGGVALPSPEIVVVIMKRICDTLGVLTEVVSPLKAENFPNNS